ncbi:MAG: AAA family ATPase [Thermoplasmatota archaeon]|nr:AAA family ATPase [Candidatus Thermoplasmatota archaeon]
MALIDEIADIQRKNGIVGRRNELERALVAIKSGKNLMIEGPVGVGKTVLAVAVAKHLGRPVFRIDGDERYTEQKLSGWFDPPIVLEKGYIADAFVPGPLTDAMREGGVLFMNEMNRMPEGVQNILLPAMDEGLIEIPKIGTVKAKIGFVVIGTQNPREFVATTALSEALSDRFELLLLDYQSLDEETEIVRKALPKAQPEIIARAVWIARRTRDHSNIRRGASIRAAMSIAQLTGSMSKDMLEGMRKAAHMALPTRIEMREESKRSADEIIDEIVNECFALPPPSPGRPLEDEKKREEERRRARNEERVNQMDIPDLVQIIEDANAEDLIRNDDIGWAIAQNYSQLRVRLKDQTLIELAKRIAVKATIRRVLQLLGPVSMPTYISRSEFRLGEDAEIDVESTLDSLVEREHLSPSDIIVERREPRQLSVAMMLDASLSMTGDKLAMATAAIAVLAFRLKTVDYILITFNDRPTVLKRINQTRSLDSLISDLLDAHAGGYTNIEGALRKGRDELSISKTKNRVGILITDGNYTVGANPADAASAYRRLFVIMTESHDCQPGICEYIAKRGGGHMYEVSSFDEIPRVLYKVLRMVAQGSPGAQR